MIIFLLGCFFLRQKDPRVVLTLFCRFESGNLFLRTQILQILGSSLHRYFFQIDIASFQILQNELFFALGLGKFLRTILNPRFFHCKLDLLFEISMSFLLQVVLANASPDQFINIGVVIEIYFCLHVGIDVYFYHKRCLFRAHRILLRSSDAPI